MNSILIIAGIILLALISIAAIRIITLADPGSHGKSRGE